LNRSVCFKRFERIIHQTPEKASLHGEKERCLNDITTADHSIKLKRAEFAIQPRVIATKEAQEYWKQGKGHQEWEKRWNPTQSWNFECSPNGMSNNRPVKATVNLKAK
jgi:uncharacterized GH25 family protein